MSTAPSPSKRERDDDGVASSEEDYFTPDSSASPGPSKKPKSPTSLNESGDHESIATPSATKAPPAEASECASQSEQLEWIFKNLRLRRIVKENHSSEINQLAFCLNQKHNKTPFGLDHVKVYEKRGAVKRDPMDNSNVLGTTGGPQANIYDNEHCGDHLDIMSHFLLDPIGEEGDEELPCFNPGTEGNTFVTGGYNGEIREWTVPAFESEPEEPIVVPLDNSRVLQSDLHSTRIDCIRFAKGKALSKSVNGKVEHWDPETLQRIRTFNIKNTASNQCRFDVSLDELFFCVGTSNGSVYVYNIDTGRTVTELKHRRSTKAIRTCIFSRDCRTVVCAGEDSFIWRYDYVTDEILSEWAAWRPEL
ncbi:hypothetical protein BGZ54_008958 [Gamsiella multidivaricata]|nr:hypothetical protein BGZ54_008958 [Gamsiella multidivaricata]